MKDFLNDLADLLEKYNVALSPQDDGVHVIMGLPSRLVEVNLGYPDGECFSDMENLRNIANK